jgi:hypothetical protein
MRIFNWAASFESQKTCDDILGRVRKTEITYWIYVLILAAVTLQGMNMMGNADPTDTKTMLIGLFVALIGIINISMMKLWAHIRLVMYYIIWDSQNRLEAELEKSRAEDL